MVIPNKKLGQHFLISQEVVEKIIAESGNIKDHHIIEIGPGNGILTKAILKASPLSLIAIEKDVRFAKEHLKLMSLFPNYQVIINDVLKDNLNTILPHSPKKIIANIPYNISSDLIYKILFEDISAYSNIILMVQKEVAFKLIASSKIALLLNNYANIRYLFEVDKRFFYPEPKVQSAVIAITPQSKYFNYHHVRGLERVLTVLFNNKRKSLSTTLKSFFIDTKAILESLNIQHNRRIETLSVDEFIQIASKIDYL